MNWREQAWVWVSIAFGCVILIQPGWSQIVPFTTLKDESQAVISSLPCKWLTTETVVQNRKVALVCKGGDWATVTLMIERGPIENSLGRVRLLYRNMQPEVQLGAGEAFVAQQFLNHVVSRLVPVSESGEVLAAFWGDESRSWRGQNVRVEVRQEQKPMFRIQELEILGNKSGFLQSVTSKNVGSKIALTANQAASSTNTVAITPQSLTNGQLTISRWGEMSRSAPLVVKFPDSNISNSNLLPYKTLLVPPGLFTQPEPESLTRPTPPPLPPVALIPSGSRDRQLEVPSNFAAYKRAAELTHDIEKRAFSVVRSPRITVASFTTMTSPDLLQAVPSPLVQISSQTVRLLSTNAQSPTAGLTVYKSSNPSLVAANKDLGLGEGLGIGGVISQSLLQDLRFVPRRPLPQLEFIPKAEPLPPEDEVILFEDEKSEL